MTDNDVSNDFEEFRLRVKCDDRLPPGIGVIRKIKDVPEGGPVIEGMVLDFRDMPEGTRIPLENGYMEKEGDMMKGCFTLSEEDKEKVKRMLEE